MRHPRTDQLFKILKPGTDSGRIAGATAAEFVQAAAKDGALNLDHVVAYNTEVEASGAADGHVSPMLIPMDTDERIRERQLTTNYVGNVR